jgi:hypothetical protein
MIGTMAIVAALFCVGSALYRFAPVAPPSLRSVTLIAAVIAGVLGVIHWSTVHDSRWLVGAILLLGAAWPGWKAGHRRGIAIVVLMLSVLGTGLYGIAASHPMQRVAVVQ